MTRKAMINSIIHRFGFGSKETIFFCTIAECKGIDNVSVENIFNGLMVKPMYKAECEVINNEENNT